jgi:hypothetical protein
MRRGETWETPIRTMVSPDRADVAVGVVRGLFAPTGPAVVMLRL